MISIKIKNVFLLINILLFSSCGDTTNITNVYLMNSSNEQNVTGQENNLSNEDNNIQEVNNSLEGIALYQANLKQINGSRRYDIENFDGITSNLTPLYFDFELKDFTPRSKDLEIFVDGKRNSFSSINYSINNKGQLLASINQKSIYSLELLSDKDIKSSRVEEYESNIDIEGRAYEIQSNYLANFYVVEKLVTSDVFEDLNAFTKKYEKKVFLGDYFGGLVFSKDNKLQEFNEGNYSDAGSYEIKSMDNLNILLIYPDNNDYYYADNSCYILNFSRVWKSKCYFKESKKKSIYYDKDVYDDLLLYLKEKLVSIKVSI
jgi:hypothetical protein